MEPADDYTEPTFAAVNGMIVMTMEPNDAGFIVNALRSHMVAKFDDDIVVEGCSDFIDAIHEAVFAAGQARPAD